MTQDVADATIVTQPQPEPEVVLFSGSYGHATLVGTTMMATMVIAKTTKAGPPVVSIEDEAYRALAAESFAADWESDADSRYDTFLEDADIR